MYGQGVSYAGSGSGPPASPKGGTVIFNIGNIPAVMVTGRGTTGVVMSNIQIFQDTANPCMIWNGDQSSIITDCQFSAGVFTSNPLIDFQSGGGFIEKRMVAREEHNRLKLHQHRPILPLQHSAGTLF
jgi:hypothetical protein